MYPHFGVHGVHGVQWGTWDKNGVKMGYKTKENRIHVDYQLGLNIQGGPIKNKQHSNFDKIRNNYPFNL